VISVENRKIFPPRVFGAPAEWVPLGTAYRRSGSKKTRMIGLPGRKEVWRYLQPSGYNPPTWWTDRHRATAKTESTHSVTR